MEHGSYWEADSRSAGHEFCPTPSHPLWSATGIQIHVFSEQFVITLWFIYGAAESVLVLHKCKRSYWFAYPRHCQWRNLSLQNHEERHSQGHCTMLILGILFASFLVCRISMTRDIQKRENLSCLSVSYVWWEERLEISMPLLAWKKNFSNALLPAVACQIIFKISFACFRVECHELWWWNQFR